MRTEKRNWSDPSYTQAVAEAQQIDDLMRSILRLFAEGCLVYRKRDRCGPPVHTKSDRLKRLRRAHPPTPADQPVVA